MECNVNTLRPLRSSRSHRFRRGLALALGFGFAIALVCGRPAVTEARGGAAGAKPKAPAKAPQLTPNQKFGAQLFDQCIWYVSQGQTAIPRTKDFHISVIAELDLDTTKHRGPMRLWWRTPDKFRQELTTNKRTTTKILNGNFMWIVHPNGTTQRMHGTPEGARAIRQLKEDRTRMGDLAQFITLQGLKGRGVTFDFQGEKKGDGDYEGQWLKVTRRAPGATTMHFWLAFDKAANGGYVAKWPGIVRIDGVASQRIPTEDFILRSWTASSADARRKFRYPKTITAYSRVGNERPVRFLRANVQAIKLNIGIPETQFRPPAPKRR